MHCMGSKEREEQTDKEDSGEPHRRADVVAAGEEGLLQRYGDRMREKQPCGVIYRGERRRGVGVGGASAIIGGAAGRGLEVLSLLAFHRGEVLSSRRRPPRVGPDQLMGWRQLEVWSPPWREQTSS